ncbi:MAG: type II secretion system minor pseudopilin GspI [Rhodoferax sp.]|nr:type II secretion system minor pseudopilin GspI [Rhodoferax sp.]
MTQLRRSRRGGFTLVEVLVALAVVTVALAAGLRAAGALTDNTERLAAVTAAQWCAENALTNLRLAAQLPGIGDADFSCEQIGRTYAGTLATRPTPNPNFRRVDASVRDESGQSLLTITTVIGRY